MADRLSESQVEALRISAQAARDHRTISYEEMQELKEMYGGPLPAPYDLMADPDEIRGGRTSIDEARHYDPDFRRHLPMQFIRDRHPPTDLSGARLHVGSTDGFPPSGVAYVDGKPFRYSGVTGNSLTEVRFLTRRERWAFLLRLRLARARFAAGRAWWRMVLGVWPEDYDAGLRNGWARERARGPVGLMSGLRRRTP